MEVVINNHGSNALIFTDIDLGDYLDFSETNDCGSQIAAGASCTVSFTFKPTRAEPRYANLVLVDSALLGPGHSRHCDQGLRHTPRRLYRERRWQPDRRGGE